MACLLHSELQQLLFVEMAALPFLSAAC